MSLLNTINLPSYPSNTNQEPGQMSSDGTNVWTSVINDVNPSLWKIPCLNPIAVKVDLSAFNNTTIGGLHSDGTNVWVSLRTLNTPYTYTLLKIDCNNTNNIESFSLNVPGNNNSIFGVTTDNQNVWLVFEPLSTISFVAYIPKSVSGGGTLTPSIINTDYNSIGISTDNTYIWVTNYGNSTVSKIDCSTQTLLQNINVPITPGIISSDGNLVWITDLGQTVIALDCATNNLIFTLSGSVYNDSFGISSNGIYVYLACNDHILILDATNANLITTVNVSQVPYFITYDGTNAWSNFEIYAQGIGGVYQISQPETVYFTTTGNPTIIAPAESQTDHYFVIFSDPNVIDYSITFYFPINVEYLLVGGGGGGGGGFYQAISSASSNYIDTGGGGGGASGNCLNGTISPNINDPVSLTIGMGGSGGTGGNNGPNNGNNGNSTIMNYNTSLQIIASGGNYGNYGYPQSGGIGGSNLSFGSGGSGAAVSSTYPQQPPAPAYNTFTQTANPATNYDNNFANYTLHGYNLGTFGGGGGGGGANGAPSEPGTNGQGSGGNPHNSGTNGGGGGGGNGSYGSLGKGGNGGNGIVILCFKFDTPDTNYIVDTVGDLSTIFYPLSNGGTPQTVPTGLLYNAGTLLNPEYKDLIELFAAYIPGVPKSIVTHMKSSAYGGVDLNHIFLDKNYHPSIYSIVSLIHGNVDSYTSTFNSINYQGLVITQNGANNTAGGAAGVNCDAVISFNQNISNVSILIVGGGGGGAGGNNGAPKFGGGGGGGGSITYIPNTSLLGNSNISITVGCAGGGRSPGNQGGGGNDAGAAGNGSSITYNDISNNNYIYTSNGGGSGLGSGTTSTGGGGGGSSTTTNGNITYGGGGGGGGGGEQIGGGAVTIGGAGGDNTYSGINQGTPGQFASSTSTSTGGNGGASWLTSIQLPFYNSGKIITLGGGGGGGGSTNGGDAGAGTGGNANSSSLGATGASAKNTINGVNAGFGGGGGGGPTATISVSQNGGGNGGKGVVMIWWQQI